MSKPISATDARRTVSRALAPDDGRIVGCAHRVGDYWAVELVLPGGAVPMGGMVPTVAIRSGELVWRPAVEVGLPH